VVVDHDAVVRPEPRAALAQLRHGVAVQVKFESKI